MGRPALQVFPRSAWRAIHGRAVGAGDLPRRRADRQARNEGRDVIAEGVGILASAAKHSPELRAAMETWKGIRFDFEEVDLLDPHPAGAVGAGADRGRAGR